MIEQLVDNLLYPDMGKYSFDLYNALKSGKLSLKMFSELIITLHRLSLCSFYETEDIDFGYVSSDFRYWDPSDLCDYGASFALLCLSKIVEENGFKKQDAMVEAGACTLNIHELIEKLKFASEILGDEDRLTDDWIEKLNAFILWTPGSESDSRFELLDIIEPSNADIIFGYCTKFGRKFLPEELKEYQPKNPEDFYKPKDILEYHGHRKKSALGYIFLDQANSDEFEKVNTAQDKAEKAQSIKELLFAIAEEDVYLDIHITFPFTVYCLLTDNTFEVNLKKLLTDEEILNDDGDIPDELMDLFIAAKEGDAAAQSKLASRYMSGDLLPQDDRRAVFWLKLASTGGDTLAQNNYGVALQKGMGGLERDYREAVEWFLKAAEKGEPVAQYNLGLAYAGGLGVKRDLREMDRWMRLAAEGGYYLAQLILENGLIIKD